MMYIEWPEVFIDPNYELTDKASACADGLVGWANCSLVGEIPDNFGKGMSKIAVILGETASPDNLMRLSEQFIRP